MRTFLAGFCAPGGPLAKAVGIFLEKQPLPGDHNPPPPWDFQKVISLKILSLGMRTFLAGFCALEVLWQNSPSLRTTTPPWEFKKVTSLKIFSLGMRTFLASFCAPGGPLAKAVGIFLEKQPLPGDHDPP